jgi:hypothetical protein
MVVVVVGCAASRGEDKALTDAVAPPALCTAPAAPEL